MVGVSWICGGIREYTALAIGLITVSLGYHRHVQFILQEMTKNID